MFDALLDINNLSTIYTLYGSVFLGLTIEILWIWNLKHPSVNTIRTRLEVSSFLLKPSINKKPATSNDMIVWILKYVRRKIDTGDDDEGHAYIQMQTNV